MFTRIMVPVDLSHRDKMTRALEIATEWARLHDSSLLLVSVESDQPSSVARNRAEFVEKLADMANEMADKTGLAVESEAIHSNDPAAEMSQALLHAADTSGADMIIMASHMPGLMDHVFSSHGGYVARHAKMSVLLVR